MSARGQSAFQLPPSPSSADWYTQRQKWKWPSKSFGVANSARNPPKPPKPRRPNCAAAMPAVRQIATVIAITIGRRRRRAMNDEYIVDEMTPEYIRTLIDYNYW